MIPYLLMVAVTAGEATLRVSAEVSNPVNEQVYGHFLEHIYQSVHGGLDAEMILDGDFESDPNTAAKGDGWATEGGLWLADGDVLRQDGTGVDTHLFWMPGGGFGARYAFTVEARKLSGAEGFLVVFGAQDTGNFHWWNLGGWGNQYSAVERETDGARGVVGGTRTETTIETGRWYTIEVVVDGTQAELKLDGQTVATVTDLRPEGFVGVGTWSTRAEFRNLAVQRADGTKVFLAPGDLAEGLSAMPAVATGWKPFGQVTTNVVMQGAYQGRFCQRIAGSRCGVGYGPLPVEADRRYAGRLAVRGQGTVMAALVAGDEVVASTEVGEAGEEWAELPFELTAPAEAEVSLVIGLEQQGTVEVDSVSLRPADAEGRPIAFREDLLAAVQGLRPPVIRWPGGCFAESYRWRDAVGPKARRPRRADAWWGYRDPNQLGTDEFLELCRTVGCEPMICLNIGQHAPDDEAQAYLDEALDWIEYCNGDADTPGGRLRAANGHPRPYHVRCWELGNETWAMQPDRYIARARLFADAIRARYPELTIAVCGSGGHNDDWNRRILDGLAGRFDQLSIHHYGWGGTYQERMANAAAYVDFIRRTRERCRASADPTTEIAVTEWNLMSTGLDSGLWAGIFLIGCEDLGDCVTMTCPALFLRETTAPDWDNALINIGPRGWFAGGNYLATKLFRDAWAPLRLGSRLETRALAEVGQTQLAEVYANATRDSNRLVIKAVNVNPDEAVALAIEPALAIRPEAEHQWLTAASPDTRNSLAEPDAIRVRQRTMTVDAARPTIELPPHSVNLIVFRLGGTE